jgi:REP element-mobilizing transposase RayT
MEKEPEAEVLKSERRLPHWNYDQSVYFVTWRIHKTQKDFSSEERDLIASVLLHFDPSRYQIFSYVIMNDHIHVLCRLKDGELLNKILHTWKSYSANRLQRLYKRSGKIWQEEYYDRIIRNEKEFYDTVRYILNNPRKRWGVEDYKWMHFEPVDVQE